MRYPQLVIFDPDAEAVRLLGERAGEHRWLVQQPRKIDSALSLAREPRPGVVIVRVEPADEGRDTISFIADVHRLCPDVPVIAVSDVKMPDADRIAWTALLFDLGARYVLFPPVTKPVLEDAVSGLMAAAVRRVVGADIPPPSPRDETIDLGEEAGER
jgi:DNA-binding NarL/FixJ family response regulator